MKIYLAGSSRSSVEEEKIVKGNGNRLHSYHYKHDVEKLFELRKRIQDENKS